MRFAVQQLEARWKALVKSPWANRWLPEVRYLEGWQLHELAILVVIGLLTSSWYTIRNDRKRHETRDERKQQQQQQDQQQDQPEEEGDPTKEQENLLQQNGDGLLAKVVAKQLFSPPVKTRKKIDPDGDDYNDAKQAQSRWKTPSLIDLDHHQLLSIPLHKSQDLAHHMGFSMGTSWERRIQTLAMFTCSLAFVMPLMSVCYGVVLHFGLFLPYHVLVSGDYSTENYVSFFAGILPDWYHSVWVGVLAMVTWTYLAWMVALDHSPTEGSRVPWIRTALDGWHAYACDFLPVVLVKTADLPAYSTKSQTSGMSSRGDGTPVKTTITATTANKYVLGYHPHGIIAVGAFCAFATDGARVLDLSQKKKKTKTNHRDDDGSDISGSSSDGGGEGGLPLTQSFLSRLNSSARSPITMSDNDDDDDNNDDDDDDSNINDNNTAPPQPSAPAARGFSTLFPNLDRRIVTLPINFKTPLLREYLLAMGAVTSQKETFRRFLGGGRFSSRNRPILPAPRALVVVVGGAAESMMAHEGQIELVLNHRRGFVREAILAGASLVPVLGFGETNLYTLYDDTQGNDNNNADGATSPTKKTSSLAAVAAFQNFVRKKFGFAMPLFAGRSIFFKSLGIMPRRRPVAVVVGKPIPPPTLKQMEIDFYHQFGPKIDSEKDRPTNEHGKILLEWHSRYVKGLEELYAEYKDAPWNGPGKRRQQSMRIVR